METKIIEELKNIFDPEIPINIYDLGLIYKIDISEHNEVNIDMTLTSPNCPMAEELAQEVYKKVSAINDVVSVNVNIVFDPPWSREMLSDEAKLELGLL